MFEYLENDQSTWKFQRLPDISEDFIVELTRIGGLNRFGQPNLRVVKGNEIKHDRAENMQLLKYHAGWTPMEVSGYVYEANGQRHFTTKLEEVPPDVLVFPSMQQEELGLLRYVIEKWTSPEELERTNRFQRRYAEGDLTPTLRDFPREGIYDTYFIVQSLTNGFKLLGPDVLLYLKFRWHWEQKSFEEQEASREQLLAEQEAARKRAYEERMEAAVNRDIRLPQEEIERREWYWRALHDYTNDAKQIAASSTHYM